MYILLDLHTYVNFSLNSTLMHLRPRWRRRERPYLTCRPNATQETARPAIPDMQTYAQHLDRDPNCIVAPRVGFWKVWI